MLTRASSRLLFGERSFHSQVDFEDMCLSLLRGKRVIYRMRFSLYWRSGLESFRSASTSAHNDRSIHDDWQNLSTPSEGVITRSSSKTQHFHEFEKLLLKKRAAS